MQHRCHIKAGRSLLQPKGLAEALLNTGGAAPTEAPRSTRILGRQAAGGLPHIEAPREVPGRQVSLLQRGGAEGPAFDGLGLLDLARKGHAGLSGGAQLPSGPPPQPPPQR